MSMRKKEKTEQNRDTSEVAAREELLENSRSFRFMDACPSTNFYREIFLSIVTLIPHAVLSSKTG